MDPLRAVAAILAVGIAAAHSVLGERFIVRRILRMERLPRLFEDDTFTRRTLRFAWHVTSVMWLAVAATLVLVDDPWALRIVSLAMLACAAITFVGARGRHVGWVAMAAVAALAWP